MLPPVTWSQCYTDIQGANTYSFPQIPGDRNVSLSFELLSLHHVLRQQQLDGRSWNYRTLHTGHADAPWECLGHREFVMRDSRETAARVQLRIPLSLTPSALFLICAVLPAARHHVPLEWLIIILQMQYEARSLVKTKKKLHPESHKVCFHYAPQPWWWRSEL